MMAVGGYIPVVAIVDELLRRDCSLGLGGILASGWCGGWLRGCVIDIFCRIGPFGFFLFCLTWVIGRATAL